MLTVNDDSPKHKKVIEYKVTETRQKHKLFAARHFIHMYVRKDNCNLSHKGENLLQPQLIAIYVHTYLGTHPQYVLTTKYLLRSDFYYKTFRVVSKN